VVFLASFLLSLAVHLICCIRFAVHSLAVEDDKAEEGEEWEFDAAFWGVIVSSAACQLLNIGGLIAVGAGIFVGGSGFGSGVPGTAKLLAPFTLAAAVRTALELAKAGLTSEEIFGGDILKSDSEADGLAEFAARAWPALTAFCVLAALLELFIRIRPLDAVLK